MAEIPSQAIMDKSIKEICCPCQCQCMETARTKCSDCLSSCPEMCGNATTSGGIACCIFPCLGCMNFLSELLEIYLHCFDTSQDCDISQLCDD